MGRAAPDGAIDGSIVPLRGGRLLALFASGNAARSSNDPRKIRERRLAKIQLRGCFQSAKNWYNRGRDWD